MTKRRIRLNGLSDKTCKERSDGIASKQVRLVRASMTIISQTCNYLVTSSAVEKSNPIYTLPK